MLNIAFPPVNEHATQQMIIRPPSSLSPVWPCLLCCRMQVCICFVCTRSYICVARVQVGVSGLFLRYALTTSPRYTDRSSSSSTQGWTIEAFLRVLMGTSASPRFSVCFLLWETIYHCSKHVAVHLSFNPQQITVAFFGATVAPLCCRTFPPVPRPHTHYTLTSTARTSYMNIALEQTEEYINGQLKRKYGDCFIRGNNGTYCSSSLCPL